MFLTTVSLKLCVSRLKTVLAKRTGRPEVELQGPEEGLGRRRSSRIMEETSGMEEEEEEETAAAVHGRRGRRDGEVLPFLFLPSIFPSIRIFSRKSVLCIRWPKY